MKNSLILFLMLASFSIQSQNYKNIKGKGQVVNKTITTTAYDGIAVSGSFFVTLIDGTEGTITINAEENLVDYIIVEVKENTLYIRPEKNYGLSASKGKKIQITVPINTISSVSLAGSGDVISNFMMNASSFKISLAGSGDIKVGIEAQNIDASVSGSGDIELKGKAMNFTAAVAGSGDIEAFELQADNAKASIAGSGDIQIDCTQSIEARVSGSGDIQYKGNPTKVDSKVSGSGTKKMN
jgi:Putative auto-transporter adhesin, head GIN domain